MRVSSVGALGLFALAVGGCKTESAKRKEVGECAAITLTVQAAATCLEVQYGWKRPAAVAAAQAFQHQRDSIPPGEADSTWRAGAAKHPRQPGGCRGGHPPSPPPRPPGDHPRPEGRPQA